MCFKQLPFTYEIIGKTIILTKKVAAKNMTSQTDDIITVPEQRKLIVHVIDSTWHPLQGAGVVVKGTKNGGLTDERGTITLTDIHNGDVLHISYVGYESKEITVGKYADTTVILKESSNPLDEIQFIAYGKTSKRLSTSSIVTVKAADIAKNPVMNVLGALEGRVTGLEITQQSGVPGAGYEVRIRGQNSISNGNNPLYIIDGVPYMSTSLSSGIGANILKDPTSPLNYISPSEIESIDVLKDADATAIYGSRGANGVVLITTKKGKSGRTSLEANVYSGNGKLTRKMKMMDTRQYLDMRYEAFRNDGTSPTAADPDLTVWDTTRNTDWQKELLGGTSHLSNAQLSLSGGNSLTTFRASGGYQRETAIFKGDFADQKASFNLGINHHSMDQKFEFAVTVNYVNDNNNLPNLDITSRVIQLPPDAPALFTPDGQLNWANSTFSNPASYLLTKYNAVTDNLISNANMAYQIIPGLRVKLNAGYTVTQLKEMSLWPAKSYDPAQHRQSSASYSTNSVKSWILEPQLTYDKAMGDGKLAVVLGATMQQQRTEMLSLFGTNYASDDLLENPASAQTLTSTYNLNLYRYSAGFLRINYNLLNKYLIDLTGRRDGSSRFGPGRQVANFGAVGAAWIFSSEKAVKESLPFLSFGKLRASYGITGNDQLPDYQFLSLYGLPGYSSYYANSYGGSVLVPSNLYNPDFRWETNKKLEIAFESGFLHDRILFSGNYFRNRSSNQLVGYPLAPTTGFTSVQANLPAIVQNTGFEFELHTKNISGHSFSWHTDANLTIPRNKLVAYPNLAGSSYATTYVIGQPLNIVRSYIYEGVDPETGRYTFKDTNGDGTINYLDRTGSIDVSQRYYGGISNTFEYKGFSLDVLFQFVKQLGKNYLTVAGYPPGFEGANQPAMLYSDSRWQKEGDIANIAKFTQSFSGYQDYSQLMYTTNGYTDASYIRLKNLSLSYSLSDKVVKRLKIQQARFYLQAQNLLTITKFQGWDPENNMSLSALPPLRMITLGLSLTL
ncbi:hypothetical protein A9P82_14530 [Arachidicoccus ginsenosidimutans]|nr:hypothetical protein A9P82_14530 [Arachidicoccus sp. BS20]